MTSIRVYNLEGARTGQLDLPTVFETPIRPDVVKKAVLAQQSHRRQPQGRDPKAGKRTTAESMGTGYGIARMARVKGSGYPRARQAAFIPSAVGGRRTFPPRATKTIYQKINKKERRLALQSAIAATANKDIVSARGHCIENVPSTPLVVSDELQGLRTAKEVKNAFENLGLMLDVLRVKKSLKIRAGKGTMRGRKRRHGVGPLFVINNDDGIMNAARNFLGIDVVQVNDLNVELLAPGTSLGRLTVWTASAMKRLNEIYV